MISTLSRIAYGPFSAFMAHRSLTFELAKRDVEGRYRGASFGLVWSLINPFLMLLVYSFAFGFVMKARWPQVEQGGADTSYTIVLFVGLIVHGFFAECLIKAPLLVTSNANFVKRVIFPLEILPWSMVASALFHTFMNFVVFLLLHLALDHTLSWTTVFLPFVLLPLVILAQGASWLLAALGVYLRDISQVTGVLATAMLFLSSAMFPPSMLPPEFRWVLMVNPLTYIINQARAVLLWSQLPDWGLLGVYTVVALIVLYVGHAAFQVTRRGFADVL